MKVYTAPDKVECLPITTPTVFLAGSIEMNKAENWQRRIMTSLENEDVILFNPRRSLWNPAWEQTESNPHFVEQVEWELKHLRAVHFPFFYFQPGTMSPVSLLELGIISEASRHGSPTPIVVCPTAFWRSGNVEITCRLAGVRVLHTLNDGIEELLAKIKVFNT